jgi:hypothetical protein
MNRVASTLKKMPDIRTSLRLALPPRALPFILARKWYLSFYLPRLANSWFVKRTPEVHGFGGSGRAPHLWEQLQSVNTLAPTRMCWIMTKYGSDKGNGWHNYTTVYSVLFKEFHDRPLRLFELGLAINDPVDVSNMGGQGRPGASLRGWRELFPHALVYGGDINRNILFQEDRIKTYYCDQLNQVAIRDLWSQPVLREGMDIIIEDGLHTFEANVSFLEGSIDCLRPGGIYIIEDIACEWSDRWCEQVESIYVKKYPNYEFAFVNLLTPLNTARDNNLLVIRRNRE